MVVPRSIEPRPSVFQADVPSQRSPEDQERLARESDPAFRFTGAALPHGSLRGVMVPSVGLEPTSSG